jgi:hypothetical protein
MTDWDDGVDEVLEAELMKQVLAGARRVWLFFVPAKFGEAADALYLKSTLVVAEVDTATLDNLHEVLIRGRERHLSLCGFTFQDANDLLKAGVPRTIDEPDRTFIHDRIRTATQQILIHQGVSFSGFLTVDEISLDDKNPRSN